MHVLSCGKDIYTKTDITDYLMETNIPVLLP